MTALFYWTGVLFWLAVAGLYVGTLAMAVAVIITQWWRRRSQDIDIKEHDDWERLRP